MHQAPPERFAVLQRMCMCRWLRLDTRLQLDNIQIAPQRAHPLNHARTHAHTHAHAHTPCVMISTHVRRWLRLSTCLQLDDLQELCVARGILKLGPTEIFRLLPELIEVGDNSYRVVME